MNPSEVSSTGRSGALMVALKLIGGAITLFGLLAAFVGMLSPFGVFAIADPTSTVLYGLGGIATGSILLAFGRSRLPTSQRSLATALTYLLVWVGFVGALVAVGWWMGSRIAVT